MNGPRPRKRFPCRSGRSNCASRTCRRAVPRRRDRRRWRAPGRCSGSGLRALGARIATMPATVAPARTKRAMSNQTQKGRPQPMRKAASPSELSSSGAWQTTLPELLARSQASRNLGLRLAAVSEFLKRPGHVAHLGLDQRTDPVGRGVVGVELDGLVRGLQRVFQMAQLVFGVASCSQAAGGFAESDLMASRASARARLYCLSWL